MPWPKGGEHAHADPHASGGQAHPLMQGFLGTQVYGPALSALGGFLGAGNALMYGGAELTNQVTGDPRAGRDALMIAQVAPMAGRPGAITRSLAAEPGGLSWRNLLPQDNGPPLPGPRVAPLMETFNRMDAERAAEVRQNFDRGAAPYRQPPQPTGTPADRVPPGVPPGTQVPIDLRLGAAIDAVGDVQPAARSAFVPPDSQAPPVERVPPGAAGPETVPYATPRGAEPPPIPPKESEPPPDPASSRQSASQPAGAQITPSAELGLTPQEEAAYRSTAEGNKLLEPQEPGVRDDKQYLTGERINEAQASQDVEVARELKSLREQTAQNWIRS